MSKSQRIRAIFEGNVIAMYSPDDERYKAAEKANRRRVSMQAQARAEQARGRHVTAGQNAQNIYGGTDLEGKPRVTPEQLSQQRHRMSLQHHVDRLKGTNPNTADKYRAIGARRGLQLASTNYYRAGLRALFESVIEEANKRKMQRQANRDYWAGEGKPFKGAGRKLANLTKKFQAKQGEKSLFRTPDPNDPSDWGIDPIPAENVNVKPKRTKKEPDKSDEKLRSPNIN